MDESVLPYLREAEEIAAGTQKQSNAVVEEKKLDEVALRRKRFAEDEARIKQAAKLKRKL